MSALPKACNLLLGAMAVVGCSERNDPTAWRAMPPVSFATAAPVTSVVTDPVGDADKTAQAYLDIVRTEITKRGTNFVFVLTMAAPVPANPELPSWADVMVWQPILDTDPTASPLGYPFTKNTANAFEFFIQHRVYRSGFTDPLDPTSAADVLVDRRPLLTGGQAIVTPIMVSIDGAQITFVVDAALLGDPSTFNWIAVSSAAKAGDDVKNAYNKHFPFDFAPDFNLGAPTASWPQ